jgi:hypothetical protein
MILSKDSSMKFGRLHVCSRKISAKLAFSESVFSPKKVGRKPVKIAL